MTLDDLKNYEEDAANHRALTKEVLSELFSLARTALSSAPVVRTPRSKQAD